MGLWSSFKESPLAQLLPCITFLISGILVIMLQLLGLIFIRPFNKRLYQSFVCRVVYLHWAQLIWLCDRWSGSEIRVFAEDKFHDIIGSEHAVIICNHREDVDWLAVWVIADRYHILEHAKCLMKNDLKYIPLVGWSFWMLDMIFVKRDYAKDKKNMMAGFQNYITYPLTCLILLFCEGTRHTAEKYEKGVKFAKENGLTPLKHHLIPRTKGFVSAMEGLQGNVPAIYDTTFGVSRSEDEPTLLNLLRGKKFLFNFHIRRIPMEEVPKTAAAQVDFIHGLYKEKDKLYDHFLQNNTFAGYDHRKMRIMPRRWAPLIIETFWLSAVVVASYYAITAYTQVSLWTTLALIGIAFAVYSLIKYMISATVSSKGSAYGSNQHKPSLKGSMETNGVKDVGKYSKND